MTSSSASSSSQSVINLNIAKKRADDILPGVTAEKLQRENNSLSVVKRTIEQHLQAILTEALSVNKYGQTYLLYPVIRDNYTDDAEMNKILHAYVLYTLCVILQDERGFKVVIKDAQKTLHLYVSWLDKDKYYIEESSQIYAKLRKFMDPSVYETVSVKPKIIAASLSSDLTPAAQMNVPVNREIEALQKIQKDATVLANVGTTTAVATTPTVAKS